MSARAGIARTLANSLKLSLRTKSSVTSAHNGIESQNHAEGRKSDLIRLWRQQEQQWGRLGDKEQTQRPQDQGSKQNNASVSDLPDKPVSAKSIAHKSKKVSDALPGKPVSAKSNAHGSTQKNANVSDAKTASAKSSALGSKQKNAKNSGTLLDKPVSAKSNAHGFKQKNANFSDAKTVSAKASALGSLQKNAKNSDALPDKPVSAKVNTQGSKQKNVNVSGALPNKSVSAKSTALGSKQKNAKISDALPDKPVSAKSNAQIILGYLKQELGPEEALQNWGGNLDSKILTLVIEGVTDVEMAKNIFTFASKIPDFKYSTHCYTSLIQLLSNMGYVQEAYNIYRKEYLAEFEPSPHVCKLLIRNLCMEGDVEEACKLLKEMKDLNLTISPRVYRYLITGFCNVGQPLEALRLFRQMIAGQMAPDMFTSSVLIDGLIKEDIGQAYELLQEMKVHKHHPEIVTCGNLIEAFCDKGRIQNAVEVMEDMLRQHTIPEVNMWTKLIDRLCKLGQPEEAVALLELLIEVETKNHNDISRLVKELCKENMAINMHLLLPKMAERGAKASEATYNALITGHCKVGRVDEAHEIFAGLKSCGYNATADAYSHLLSALSSGLSGTGCLLKVMKILGCPTSEVSNNIVQGYCKTGELAAAEVVLQQMDAWGQKPEIETIYAICKVKECEPGRFLDQMLHNGHITSDAYSSLMDDMRRNNEAQTSVEEVVQTSVEEVVQEHEIQEAFVQESGLSLSTS